MVSEDARHAVVNVDQLEDVTVTFTALVDGAAPTRQSDHSDFPMEAQVMQVMDMLH